jgi:ABC-type glycerol-3-phosphate transport system permease component
MAKLSKKEKNENKLLWERRVLYGAFGLGLFASFLLLIAVSTEHWVNVKFPYSTLRNDTGRGGEFYKTGHYHGLWRICREEYVNSTGTPFDRLYCQTMYFVRQPEHVKFGKYDYEILHYRRSSAIISLIGLVLSIIAHGFTWYSMAQMRYMFKRLAASLHLITGACCWVTVEVFKRSMDYTRAHLQDVVPPGSDVSLGFSYVLGWISFIFFLIVSITLFACSRKRKGRSARSVKEAKENEPVVLGRV